MEKCDRCATAPKIMGALTRLDGRKLCPPCKDVVTGGTILVGTARIPIFAEV